MTGVPDRGEGGAENLGATASQSLSVATSNTSSHWKHVRDGYLSDFCETCRSEQSIGHAFQAWLRQLDEILARTTHTGQRHSADHRKDSP